ncbi:hypothetical protein EH165_05500 [Nakamurella antarctica]|uniref:Uncharacterized protein n=1 Tax=Nakamurella antarctica TaxID=1902245 RepID=A0A3G8ZKH5_9ACTN|nr:hypothetical protein [Nakamurella antarctica]AZI57688.1 hypothetical protein EH165_05500 [Nakamurella antarctica]
MSWPVASDSAPRVYDQPRPHGLAAVLLIIGGACGVTQWFIKGYPVGQLQPVGGSSYSGSALLANLQEYSGETAFAITRVALLIVTIGGGGIVILALAMLLPVNHRPLGVAGLVLAAGAAVSAVWTISKASEVLGSAASSLLSSSDPGWYLMVATAVFGGLGSVAALARR